MNRPASILLLTALLLGASQGPAAMTTRVRISSSASYSVRITPTELPPGSTAIDIGPTLWSVQGFDLRGLLAQVYGFDPARIDLLLPASESDLPRFDVALSLAGTESDATIRTILGAAIERQFHLAASIVTRSVDVLVLTAPHGAGSGLQGANATSAHVTPVSLGVLRSSAIDLEPNPAGDVPEAISIAGRICPGISSAGITARGATLRTLARTLEEQLARPVVDETNLPGAYNFEIPEYRTEEQLLTALSNRLGLKVTLDRRELTILAIQSAAPESQTAALDPQPALSTSF